ncbi:hypothetical protein ES332_A05G301000v1 [Gossypium tomentosum]|uniref:Uncharacterized protein n=1 Tax=Gossypium tomentosum TaxID=34277 RepID=A0A5D2QL20_GOSTO|nr:hypothetical protein ES332_A05G301000v1 [Gossypium tomentosum]
MANLAALPHLPQYTPGMLINGNKQLIKSRAFPVFAAKSGPLNSILKRCQKCGGKGAIECPGWNRKKQKEWQHLREMEML